jgi:CDP-diacylglycerol--glycerol-3-phosphate 3-phosphatidyltransferase
MPLDVWILLIANGGVIFTAILYGIFIYPHQELSEETKRRDKSFITNSFFREFWYFLTGPLKRKLIDWDVKPNTITAVGFVFSLIAGAFFAYGEFGIGGWFVILAATCDIYDGQLARAREITFKSGAFLDSTLDRVGEVGIFYGLARFFAHDDSWFLIIFMGFAAAQVVSYSRARAEGLGFEHLGKRGFFQRAERMTVLSFAMPLSPLAELLYPGGGFFLVKTGIALLCFGSMQTALTRTVSIFRGMRASERG